MLYKTSSEPTLRFEVDLNHHSHHLQRINDFLAGMGVKLLTLCFDGIYAVEMTQAQKARWDAWFANLP